MKIFILTSDTRYGTNTKLYVSEICAKADYINAVTELATKYRYKTVDNMDADAARDLMREITSAGDCDTFYSLTEEHIEGIFIPSKIAKEHCAHLSLIKSDILSLSLLNTGSYIHTIEQVQIDAQNRTLFMRATQSATHEEKL